MIRLKKNFSELFSGRDESIDNFFVAFNEEMAITDEHGNKTWHNAEGKLHNDTMKNDRPLPAMRNANGTQEWWLNGEPYSFVDAEETQYPIKTDADGNDTYQCGPIQIIEDKRGFNIKNTSGKNITNMHLDGEDDVIKITMSDEKSTIHYLKCGTVVFIN